ncbi:hypothetical protein [Xanthomonas citri]|uniref:hypothetical protein n=1 Tax=Xanthomonas citri TaxID=346 RepID=UPI000A2FC11D|nr:hypothetical protein [Xanthomonas citri]ARR20137.1 hypothetical protein B7L65_25170 [Xanthomonas citri pv. citri]ARR24776.1 hypothetical protein B7L67_25130 [Xanthomonas citri pv. citri]
MARKPSALPKIPVKTERVTKRLQFDPNLIKRVEAFCDFYAETVGAKPDWNDAAVALIEHALDGNRDFIKHLAEQNKPAT